MLIKGTKLFSIINNGGTYLPISNDSNDHNLVKEIRRLESDNQDLIKKLDSFRLRLN